ncbi:MAG: LEA type 2 family protein [Treponemataceae bacterium]
MSAFRHLFPLAFVLAFFASCASPPPAPVPVPAAPPAPDLPVLLSIEKVKLVPRGLDSVSLAFSLVVKNADTRPVALEKLSWILSIDGVKAAESSPFQALYLEAGAAKSVDQYCVVSIPASSRDMATYTLAVSVSRKSSNDSSLVSTAESSGRFPVIRPPVFSIQSIKIKKSELINTKFEVVLRVENPNVVPLSLTSMEYELFGEQRLWTDGETKEPIPVAANGTVEKKLKLIMNFINMKRELLDQVIKLEIVDYRFKGNAKIATDLPEFPEFVMPYDLEGTTSVVE